MKKKNHNMSCLGIGRGQLGLFDRDGRQGAQSSLDGLDFESGRRDDFLWWRWRGRLECCQGGVEPVGFEESEVPCLLVACICKCAADPVGVVEGYAEKFSGFLEMFLGLDQVFDMFEHALIFDDGPGISFPDKGENWVVLNGGGESIELLVDNHGTNSLFGPGDSALSGGRVALWCGGVQVVWRGVDVVGDVRGTCHV